MNLRLRIQHSRNYARCGFGFGGALLKHSLMPLDLLEEVLPRRGLLLDLGCGDGILANLVAATHPGLKVQGIDLDAPKVDLANRNAPQNASYEAGDILTCPPRRAVAAIFNDVLHHHPFDRQLELLKRAADFLEEDGVLILKEVDVHDSLDRAWTTLWDRKLYPADKLHFRDVTGWRAALCQAGFELLRVHRVRHPWPASRTVLVSRRRKAAASGPAAAKAVRILVTGGTGFIGRHLVRHLYENGLEGRAADVVVLTRDVHQAPAELDGMCRLVEASLEALPQMRDLVSDVEYVFHLAADKAFFGGKQVLLNNVNGTKALLEALEGASRLKRLIFASSMGAIDRPPKDDCRAPLTETSPAYPSSQYGLAKLECEALVAGSGLPFAILRLPWVYGPGMTPQTHVRMLTEMVMKGKLAGRLNWPGRVSVLDVHQSARAFAFVATEPRTLGQTLFVSDGQPIGMGALFQGMGRISGRRAGNIPIPGLVSALVRRFRRFVPFTLRSLFLDVLWVDDRKLRELGFSAAPRSENFLIPLARFIHHQRAPGIGWSKALVTGAASGIGHALAVQLAGSGQQVIMLDRDPRLAAIAGAVAGAEACLADLASEEGLRHALDRVGDSSVSLVINCAGIGVRGTVGGLDQEAVSRLLAVNVAALTQISEAAMRNFHSAGEGVLVNIASSAGLQPLAGMAAYAASKAYVLSFSEAAGAEVHDLPAIGVMTVCPSGVATNFQTSAGVRVNIRERLLSPEYVASRILRAAQKRRSRTIFLGGRTSAMALLGRLLPRSLNVVLWRRLMDLTR